MDWYTRELNCQLLPKYRHSIQLNYYAIHELGNPKYPFYRRALGDQEGSVSAWRGCRTSLEAYGIQEWVCREQTVQAPCLLLHIHCCELWVGLSPFTTSSLGRVEYKAKEILKPIPGCQLKFSLLVLGLDKEVWWTAQGLERKTETSKKRKLRMPKQRRSPKSATDLLLQRYTWHVPKCISHAFSTILLGSPA